MAKHFRGLEVRTFVWSIVNLEHLLSENSMLTNLDLRINASLFTLSLQTTITTGFQEFNQSIYIVTWSWDSKVLTSEYKSYHKKYKYKQTYQPNLYLD